MRNKCLLGLGLVFVISLTSMVAFAFSFTGTPADEVDETEMIVRAVVSEEADAMPTTEPITTTGQEQEMVKKEQSKIGSMDWDSDDAYRLAKIAMAEAESEDTEGKALVMLVVLNRVWDDEFPDTIEEVIFQKGQFSPISNGRYDEVEPDEDCYRALQLIQTGGWDESHGATYFESKPFVVPTVTFAPDYTDPTVRSAMLQQGMNSMGNMFGASSTPPAISTAFSGEAFSSDFNPEDEIDNPAFASEQAEDSDGAVEEQERNWFDQERPAQEQPQPTTNGNETTGYFCDGCGAEINERVYEYSLNKFGRPLCMKCQKGAGK